MLEKLKSRKFWFALLGAILPIVAQILTGDVTWETALQLSSAIIVAYIFGQGYVDAQEASGDAVSPLSPSSEDTA
jgi:uncharacterized membrane protein